MSDLKHYPVYIIPYRTLHRWSCTKQDGTVGAHDHEYINPEKSPKYLYVAIEIAYDVFEVLRGFWLKIAACTFPTCNRLSVTKSQDSALSACKPKFSLHSLNRQERESSLNHSKDAKETGIVLMNGRSIYSKHITLTTADICGKHDKWWFEIRFISLLLLLQNDMHYLLEGLTSYQTGDSHICYLQNVHD